MVHAPASRPAGRGDGAATISGLWQLKEDGQDWRSGCVWTSPNPISDETVRRRLKNHLKLWLQAEWSLPSVSPEFVWRMEDLLDLYAERNDRRVMMHWQFSTTDARAASLRIHSHEMSPSGPLAADLDTVLQQADAKGHLDCEGHCVDSTVIRARACCRARRRCDAPE